MLIHAHAYTFTCIILYRSCRRGDDLTDFGANRNRIELIKKTLRLDNIAVLRNRRRAFLFGESPFDTFGPPTSMFEDGVDQLSGILCTYVKDDNDCISSFFLLSHTLICFSCNNIFPYGYFTQKSPKYDIISIISLLHCHKKGIWGSQSGPCQHQYHQL